MAIHKLDISQLLVTRVAILSANVVCAWHYRLFSMLYKKTEAVGSRKLLRKAKPIVNVSTKATSRPSLYPFLLSPSFSDSSMSLLERVFTHHHSWGSFCIKRTMVTSYLLCTGMMQVIEYPTRVSSSVTLVLSLHLCGWYIATKETHHSP